MHEGSHHQCVDHGNISLEEQKRTTPFSVDGKRCLVIHQTAQLVWNAMTAGCCCGVSPSLCGMTNNLHAHACQDRESCTAKYKLMVVAMNLIFEKFVVCEPL